MRSSNPKPSSGFLLVFRLVCWISICCSSSTSSPGVGANNSPVGSGTGTQPDPTTTTTSNPTNGSSSGSGSGWNLKSDRPASEVVRDIVIIFFAGVAIIGSLVCATYIVTLLFDRFRGWFGIPLLEDDVAGGTGAGPVYSQPVHVGRLVHEAGLHGITKEQRMLLVQCILPPIPYDGKGFGGADDLRYQGEGKDVERAVVGDVDSGVIKHDVVEDDDDEGPVLADVDDIDYEHTCSICLAPYELGSNLLRSRRCVHVFHWECCQEWLQKRDVCPYCRTPMYTADDLREAAAEVLGPTAPNPVSRASASNPSRGAEGTSPAQDTAVASGDPNDEEASRSAAGPPSASPQLEDDTTRRSQVVPPSEPEMAALESRNEQHAPEIGSA